MDNNYHRAFSKLVRRTFGDELPTQRITMADGEVLSPDELLAFLTTHFGSENCPDDASFYLESNLSTVLTIKEAVEQCRGRVRARDIRNFNIEPHERAEVIADLALSLKCSKSIPQKNPSTDELVSSS